jgi:hypothetical protein
MIGLFLFVPAAVTGSSLALTVTAQWLALRRGELQLPDQIMDADAEGVCHQFQGVNGYITFASLDFPNVRSVQTRAISEDVLGPATLQAQRSNGSANFFLNLLHSSEFGRTLVRSIQVISCTARKLCRRCARVKESTSSFKRR